MICFIAPGGDKARAAGLPARPHTQCGATLIELLAVVGVGALLIVSMNSLVDTSISDIKGQQAAAYQSQLTEAARRYLAAKYADLITATAGGPTIVTLAQLKADRFLPAALETTNGYGQTACVLIRQPQANKLEALVTTYGGTAIPDKDLVFAAMNAGPGGGYITAAKSTEIRGGSWSMANDNTSPYRNLQCGGNAVLTAGHLVSSLYYDGTSANENAFIYRDAVSGHPEFNRMNTPLRIGAAALRTAGTSCSTGPAITIDSVSGEALICHDGTWIGGSSPYWKDPVANYQSLAGIPATAGDVRLTRDTNRAYAYNGSGWVALAVDQDGNLNVPGRLQAQTVQASGDIQSLNGDIRGNDFHASRDMHVAGNVNASGSVRADMSVEAYWMRAATYQVTYVVEPNENCNYMDYTVFGDYGTIWPIGSFGVDANGVPMSCQSSGNVFRYANGGLAP